MERDHDHQSPWPCGPCIESDKNARREGKKDFADLIIENLPNLDFYCSNTSHAFSDNESESLVPLIFCMFFFAFFFGKCSIWNNIIL